MKKNHLQQTKRPLVLWKCLWSKKTVSRNLVEEKWGDFLWTVENKLWFPTPFLHLKSPAHLSLKCFSRVHSSCIANSFPSSLQHCPVHPTLPSGSCSWSPVFPLQVSPSPLWSWEHPDSLHTSFPCVGQSPWWTATCVSIGKLAASDKDELSVFPLTGYNKVSFL